MLKLSIFAVLSLATFNCGEIFVKFTFFGAALFLSSACPRFVLICPFCLFVVLTMSLYALVMSQACPQVSTYSLCCLCQYLFQAEGFSKDLHWKSERQYTFLNMSFSLIANRQTFESQYLVLCKTICTMY